MDGRLSPGRFTLDQRDGFLLCGCLGLVAVGKVVGELHQLVTDLKPGSVKHCVAELPGSNGGDGGAGTPFAT